MQPFLVIKHRVLSLASFAVMGDLEALATRVAASKALMSVLAGSPGIIHVSASERATLQPIFEAVDLSINECTQYIKEITSIGFERADELKLLGVIQGKLAAPPVCSPPQPLGRRPAAIPPPPVDCGSFPLGATKIQNFESIANFFTTEVHPATLINKRNEMGPQSSDLSLIILTAGSFQMGSEPGFVVVS